MNYRYLIRLYPELIKTRDGLDLTDSLKSVKEVAADYNTSSITASNKKIIDVDSITIENGNTITLELLSDAWLQFPTKALRSFISKLSKISPYKNLITPNGRLFKGEYEVIDHSNTEETTLLPLSDEETLVAVTRLFFRETLDHREKIEKIKSIIRGGSI